MSIRKRLEKVASTDPYQFPKTWRVPGGESARSGKKRKELDLWRQWKETNENPTHLAPLLTSLRPTIDYRVNMYAPANVYRPALRAKANNLTINALRRFDPSKSQLNTHVTNHLKGLNRWTGKHQNVSRITEERIAIIGQYNASKAKLSESMGHEPTARQISQDMRVPEKIIKKLELENRPDLIASAFDGDAFATELDAPTVDKEIMDLIEFDLSPDQRRLWEYLYGIKGKKQTSKGGDLARKLGWSQSKVSQIRKSIYKKVEYYTQGLS
jgi:hypothetical protein